MLSRALHCIIKSIEQTGQCGQRGGCLLPFSGVCPAHTRFDSVSSPLLVSVPHLPMPVIIGISTAAEMSVLLSPGMMPIVSPPAAYKGKERNKLLSHVTVLALKVCYVLHMCVCVYLCVYVCQCVCVCLPVPVVKVRFYVAREPTQA